MFLISKRFLIAVFLFASGVLVHTAAIANDTASYFNIDSIPSYQLTDKINFRFVTSSKFTVIQWGLKSGAKLPVHSHPNEQVTRVLEGNVDVHTAYWRYGLSSACR